MSRRYDFGVRAPSPIKGRRVGPAARELLDGGTGRRSLAARHGFSVPARRTQLVEVERSGVRVDARRTCRGVWLDRGELDKILEREAQALRPPG